MKAIFASKIYKGSSVERKNKIQSAVSDPINTELMQQLREYLDDEYISQEYLDPDPDSFGNTEESNSPEGSPSEDAPASPRGPAPAHFSAPPMGGPEIPDEESEDVFDESEEADDLSDEVPEGAESEEGDVAESTRLPKASKVTSCVDVSSISSELKGTLNARDDTNGVSRVRVKDNEVWIHYNDSISLNNVMDTVIDVVFRLGYTYLQFDRLARSENAVVFIIDELSSVEGTSSDDEQ